MKKKTKSMKSSEQQVISAAFLFRTRNIHTMRHEDGWAIRRESGECVLRVFDTQQEAIQRGREIAEREGIEHLIHGRDGRIRERNTYGADQQAPGE